MEIPKYKEIVKRFILQDDTSYALMLDGEWGSGKTHFWENIICKEILEETKKVSTKHAYIPIYISLNGKASVEEIKTEILQTQIAQRTGVSLNTIKIGHLLGSGILKFAKQTLDINKIAEQFDLDLSEGGLQKNIFKNIKSPFSKKDEDLLIKASQDPFRFLICFDDLERSRVNIQEVWGVMSDFVEQQKNTKVIILANTKELEEDTKKQFNKIKEKVVGQNIPFKPTGRSVLEEFVRKIAENYQKEQTDYQSNFSSATFIIKYFQEELINAVDVENLNFRVIKTAIKKLFELLDIIVRSNRQVRDSNKLKVYSENGFPISKKVLQLLIYQTIKISSTNSLKEFNQNEVHAFINRKKTHPFNNPNDIGSFLSYNYPDTIDEENKGKMKPYEAIEKVLAKQEISYNDANEEILSYIVFYSFSEIELLRILKIIEEQELEPDIKQAYDDFKVLQEYVHGKEHNEIIDNLQKVLENLKLGRYHYISIYHILEQIHISYLSNGYYEINEDELMKACEQGLSKISLNTSTKIYHFFYVNEVLKIHTQYYLLAFKKLFDKWRDDHNYKLELEQGKKIHKDFYDNGRIDFDILWHHYSRGNTGFFVYLCNNDLIFKFLKIILSKNEYIHRLTFIINMIYNKCIIVDNPKEWQREEKIKDGLSEKEIFTLRYLGILVRTYQNKKFDRTKEIHLNNLVEAIHRLCK